MFVSIAGSKRAIHSTVMIWWPAEVWKPLYLTPCNTPAFMPLTLGKKQQQKSTMDRKSAFSPSSIFLTLDLCLVYFWSPHSMCLIFVFPKQYFHSYIGASAWVELMSRNFIVFFLASNHAYKMKSSPSTWFSHTLTTHLVLACTVPPAHGSGYFVIFVRKGWGNLFPACVIQPRNVVKVTKDGCFWVIECKLWFIPFYAKMSIPWLLTQDFKPRIWKM